MIVNQWVPAAHRGDAIGDSARRVRDLLRQLGHDADIFALTIDDDLRGDVIPWTDPGARRGDLTIFHFALVSPMTAEFARLAHIDLTTVSQNGQELTEHAVAAVVERLDGGRTDPREVVVAPRLVVRGTTGPPRQR